ncbi:unnamed protein product [Allacma fusca]|uniref:BTB domain-containing protein n=1 Tax=Allacma fusca TaxID=39272 RepID=A0A8J2LH45_9HEXA|nr:unnamed protein product [Allacma fusca]
MFHFHRKDTTSRWYASTKRVSWASELVWEIYDLEKHFKLNSLENFGSLSSPFYALRIDAGKQIEWQIHMSGARGLDGWVAIVFKLYLRNTSSKRTEIDTHGLDCEYVISVGEETTGTPVYRLTSRETIKPGTYGGPLRIKYNEFIDKKASLFPQNILLVRVNLEIIHNPLHSEVVNHGQAGAPVIVQDQLASRYSNYYMKKEMSDVTIYCGKTAIPAHKIVLAGASSVFAKMLQTQMKEAILNQIHIKEIKLQTLQQMLKYFYTGRLDIPKGKNDLLQLLDCAERYDLQKIKAGCFKTMVHLLSDENAGEFTLAAATYNSEKDARKVFTEYCKKRHSVLIENYKYKQLFKDNIDAYI